MESNNQNRALPEKTELSVGALVSLFVNGKRLSKEILERRAEHLLLGALEESWEVPFHHQTACLVQMLPDQRILFAVLRYEEGRGRGLGRRDLFRLIPGGSMYIWSGLNKMAMHEWCPLKVYDPYLTEEVLLEDQAFLFALSETEASMMVHKPLPLGAFADCTFVLDEKPLVMRAVLARCEDLDGGAGYRAHFMLIDPQLQPLLREFLLEEQARRLQAAVI
ncbi:MAG: hypothetical protein VB051_00905 [Candidatus Pelethousia sp.]|nr:hypothetical protein [Candidatus Pelethousia sp.]